MTEQAAPSKGDQLRALIKELREVMQVAAGGTDACVQNVLQRMEAVLQPPPQS